MVRSSVDVRALQAPIRERYLHWDARGTLAVPNVPIGVTAIRTRTRVVVAGDERGERAERLLRSAEKYCVVLNTLRAGVPVDTSFVLERAM